MSSIVLKDICKSFSNGFQLLQRVNVEFDDRAINFVVGRSGAGKTTLLQIIGGQIQPTSGELLVNGVDVCQFKSNYLVQYRRLIGFVTQSSSLVLQKTVFENVAMPLRIQGLSESAIQHRVGASLRIVGMQEASHLLPSRLSSGERQRVSIARAVVHRPKLLIADEPTANFDQELAEEVLGLFELFVERNIMVIVAAHDASRIAPASRMFLLQGGRVEPT